MYLQWYPGNHALFVVADPENCFPVSAAGFGYWFICSDTAQSRSAASGSSA
jgi:hypothetical protein